MLGNRSFKRIIKALFSSHYYLALLECFKKYDNPVDGIYRYFFGKGNYPVEFKLKTPVGIVSPTLYSYHDMLTVNEIFCRMDYGDDRNIQVILDLGSNIGLSALYFLTRNNTSTCYLFEPNPENVKKLKKTLDGFENRYNLSECAVAEKSGEISFGIEESGRYGGIGKKEGTKASSEQPLIHREITVKCLEINDVLSEIFKKESSIDLIKIDTEGSEFDIINSIKPEYLSKIGKIYVEAQESVSLPGFTTEKYKTVYLLKNVNLSS